MNVAQLFVKCLETEEVSMSLVCRGRKTPIS